MQKETFPKPYPALKPTLEAVPIDHEGQPMILLRDTENTTPSFVLSQAGMLLASLLNGRNSLDVIKSEFHRHTGSKIEDSDILPLVTRFEKAGLLDTPAARAKRQKEQNDFRASSERLAVHAHGGYPADPQALRVFLDQFTGQALHSREDRAESPKVPAADSRPPTGAFVPHIDFHRGGAAYGRLYAELFKYPRPDLIIALGVAHESPKSPWVMTRKRYATPLGPMEVDRDAYAELAKALWYDPVEDELVHRREHSLEFQAVWLKHLWQDQTPPWVPILCSSFQRYSPDGLPSAMPLIEATIRSIGALLKKRQEAGQRILILGGVDFAHVGPRFGDEMALDPETEKRIEAADRESIDEALALQADPFYRLGVGVHGWRKVCGLSAIYTGLRWIRLMSPDAKGTLLTYDQAADPLGGIVSYAGIVFR